MSCRLCSVSEVTIGAVYFFNDLSAWKTDVQLGSTEQVHTIAEKDNDKRRWDRRKSGREGVKMWGLEVEKRKIEGMEVGDRKVRG